MKGMTETPNEHRVFSRRAWKTSRRAVSDHTTAGDAGAVGAAGAGVRGRGRLRRRARRGGSRWRIKLGTLFVLACLVALVLPSGYVIESPGPTHNVLGKIGDTQSIAITGAERHEDSGQLLMTTINASGMPGSPALNFEALLGWVSPSQIVMPREVVYPADKTRDDYVKESEAEMTGAQSAAETNALAFLKARGFDTSSVHLSLDGGDVGGPSAGLMYTLGIIDLMTPESETGGLVIAGTGTMEDGGAVGPIGGIRLKLLASQRDGAKWFLAPADNCDEVVGHVPDGLRVVKVSTLAEAYQALVTIGDEAGGNGSSDGDSISGSSLAEALPGGVASLPTCEASPGTRA